MKIISSDTIKITELPIGSWTTDYNAFLENLMSIYVIILHLVEIK